MLHLGDITKIKGSEASAVDVIIGGSPCQDLSIAGKRAGLAGARSGLYMEQIRIIKEMREADAERGRPAHMVRPRYMVWENVPGAFSSNGGQDFAAVIEEAIRVAEPQAPPVCVPEKGWPTSGCFFDEMGRWSVAWRVLDAQHWGVAQRRRRIALVADFGGLSAPEILFVRQSVSGYFDESEQTREATAGDPGESSDGASWCLQGSMIGRADKNGPQGDGINEDVSFTLNTIDRHAVSQPILLESNQNHASIRTDGVCTMLPAAMGMGGGYTPMVCAVENHPQDSRVKLSEDNVVQTLSSKMGTGGNVPLVMELVANETYEMRSFGEYVRGGVASTVKARDYKDSSDLVVAEISQPTTYQKVTGPLMANSHPGSYTGQDAYNDMLIASVDCRNGTECPGVNGTLQAKANGGQSLNCNQVVRVQHIVRRLTPLECERLQGFPDGWTDIGEWTDSKGKKHKPSDSPRYKALGNSIAIPPWKWILKRLCGCYERDATMASLFDGIGGFPYIWEQLNGKGSCLWASEIEEFPMAVTKLRFGGGA